MEVVEMNRRSTILPLAGLFLVVVFLRAGDDKPPEDPFATRGHTTNRVVDPVFVVVPDASGHDYFPKDHASYYTYYLSAMKEPSLKAPDTEGQGERYRFTWLRSFHHPIAIRVWQSGAEFRIRAVEMKVKKEDYSIDGVVSDTTRVLSDKEIAEIQKLAEAKDFWAPLTPQEDLRGLDGAAWLFEHRKGSSYVFLDLWSPRYFTHEEAKKMGLDPTKIRDFDPYVRLGKYLLEITHLLPKNDQDVY